MKQSLSILLIFYMLSVFVHSSIDNKKSFDKKSFETKSFTDQLEDLLNIEHEKINKATDDDEKTLMKTQLVEMVGEYIRNMLKSPYMIETHFIHDSLDTFEFMDGARTSIVQFRYHYKTGKYDVTVYQKELNDDKITRKFLVNATYKIIDIKYENKIKHGIQIEDEMHEKVFIILHDEIVPDLRVRLAAEELYVPDLNNENHNGFMDIVAQTQEQVYWDHSDIIKFPSDFLSDDNKILIILQYVMDKRTYKYANYRLNTDQNDGRQLISYGENAHVGCLSKKYGSHYIYISLAHPTFGKSTKFEIPVKENIWLDMKDVVHGNDESSDLYFENLKSKHELLDKSKNKNN